MARCEVCGHEYDRAMEVTIAGETHAEGATQVDDRA